MGEILGHESLTVSTTAVGLTVPSFAVSAMIQVADAAIRWRADGTDPTASVGFPEDINSQFIIDGTTDMSKFKAIRSGSVDATLDIIYERPF